jgi:CRP-like cAMP-binding protein
MSSVVRRKIITKLPIVEVEDNTIIFEQGEEDSTVYFVLEGGVKIYENKNGNEHQIGTVKKHEFFGENEIYTHTPRNGAAKTTEPTKLILIKTEAQFEHFVTENHWVVGKVMETMSERMREINAILATKIQGSAIKVELAPDIKPEDKSPRRIIHR